MVLIEPDALAALEPCISLIRAMEPDERSRACILVEHLLRFVTDRPLRRCAGSKYRHAGQLAAAIGLSTAATLLDPQFANQ